MSTELLPQWHAMREYIRTMHAVVTKWFDFAACSKDFSWFDQQDVSGWLEQLRHTFVVMEHRYAFDAIAALSIYGVHSGFPMRHQIRSLPAEVERLAEPLVSMSALKQEALQLTLANEGVNTWLMQKIALARAYELIQEEEPMPVFSLRRLTRVASHNGAAAYRCVWHSYGYKHQPALYFMLFESPVDELSLSDLQFLQHVLAEETTQMPMLAALAGRIDTALSVVYPKVLARIALGPVFLAGTTHDRNPIQAALDETAGEGDLLAASRIIYEYVLADKQEAARSLVDAHGRRHKVLHRYAVRSYDEECEARGVTSLRKWLFAPHRVLQEVNPNFLLNLGHMIVS